MQVKCSVNINVSSSESYDSDSYECLRYLKKNTREYQVDCEAGLQAGAGDIMLRSSFFPWTILHYPASSSSHQHVPFRGMS